MLATIVRPRMANISDPTHITYKWGQNIIDYALSRGVDTLDITDEFVEYDKITPLLGDKKTDLFVYTGHGCTNFLSTPRGCSITNGWREDTCQIQCGQPPNLKLLRDAIIVTFSCHSATQLGKCAIKYGAKAYIGFSDYMMFSSDGLGSQEVFRDALLPLALELINGKSVGEAVDITKAGLLADAKQWKAVKYMAIPLYWNYEYMTVLGDLNAKLGGY